MAMNLDRAVGELARGVGRGGERRLGRQLEMRAGTEDALAERDRRDVPLPHRAQRHRDPGRAWRETALIGMRDDAGIHQRGGGIAVLVAEIGPDQLLPGFRQHRAVDRQRELDLIVADHEHAARLPVTRLEVLEHDLELAQRLLLVERQHRIDDPPHASGAAVGRPQLDRDVERPNHHARWIGLQPQGPVNDILAHPPVPRPGGTSYGRDVAASASAKSPVATALPEFCAIAQQAN